MMPVHDVSGACVELTAATSSQRISGGDGNNDTEEVTAIHYPDIPAHVATESPLLPPQRAEEIRDSPSQPLLTRRAADIPAIVRWQQTPSGETALAASRWWSSPNRWVEVERADHSQTFYTPPNGNISAARKFVSVYTTLETGFVVATYFFLLFYWHVPYLLPGMFISQIFLQFLLFLYSDYFCQLTYRITCDPRGSRPNTCYFSVCDWTLIFCFSISWSAALIVIAPVFAAWRNFVLFPPLHEVTVSALTSSGVYSTTPNSGLYFNRGVFLDYSTTTAMMIESVMRNPDVDHESVAMKLPTFSSHYTSRIHTVVAAALNNTAIVDEEEIDAIQTLNPKLDEANLKEQVAPENNFLQTKLQNETRRQQTLTQLKSSRTHRDSSDYSHRIWPNLWLGYEINSTVAAVRMEDWWLQKVWDARSKNPLSTKFRNDINVWAVCSDAATLGCSCGGVVFDRILQPRKCSGSGFCGIEMLGGMATQSSVRRLVIEAKKLLKSYIPATSEAYFVSPLGIEGLSLDIPHYTRDRYICLLDPEVLNDQILVDMRLGFFLAAPFIVALIFISIRLLFFYLFELTPEYQSEDPLIMPTLR